MSKILEGSRSIRMSSHKLQEARKVVEQIMGHRGRQDTLHMQKCVDPRHGRFHVLLIAEEQIQNRADKKSGVISHEVRDDPSRGEGNDVIWIKHQRCKTGKDGS
jgi:hypothetical protein